MIDEQIAFSTEERQYLVGLLETALKDSLIEAQRTRTSSYRDSVLHREQTIRGMLDRLRQAED